MSEEIISDATKARDLLAADRLRRQDLCNHEIQEAIGAICAKHNCRIELILEIRNGAVSQILAAVALD